MLGGRQETYDPHLAKEPTACEKPIWFRSICNSMFSVLLRRENEEEEENNEERTIIQQN